MDLAKQYTPKGVQFLGVSFDDDSDMNLVRHFLVRNHPGFPNLRLQPGNDEPFIRGVNPRWTGSLPATAFYSADGRLISQFIGTRSREEFEKAIREILRDGANGSPSESRKAPGQ